MRERYVCIIKRIKSPSHPDVLAGTLTPLHLLQGMLGT